MALIPLPDFVHFPKTDLHLEFEASDRTLADAIIARSELDENWLGTTLLKPEWAWQGGAPEIFSAGTAVRVIEHTPLSEGGCRIVLHGEYRFELSDGGQRDVGDGPLHEALVRRIDEPFVSNVDPAIMALRDELLTLIGSLANALGGRFPIHVSQLAELDSEEVCFEGLVNAVASALDLSSLRKQSLLADDLPERAKNLHGILRSRVSMMELLRPFQYLALHAEHN